MGRPQLFRNFVSILGDIDIIVKRRFAGGMPPQCLAIEVAGQAAAPFDILVVAIDSFDELMEESELNNIAVLQRSEIVVIGATTETTVTTEAAQSAAPVESAPAAVAPVETAPAANPPGENDAPDANAPAAPSDKLDLDDLDLEDDEDDAET